MNLLKKARIVLIAFFALLFSLTIASCDKSSDEPVNPGQGITDNDESFTKANANVSEDGYDFDNANLSSIDINVSNAKTTFFLGDTFSSEGVTVTANFLTSVDGKNKLGSFTTTDFTVDSSEVDMYNIGTYPVEVTYRYKATVNKKSYNINVISSELANSGLEYVGGIEAKYKDSGNKYVTSISLELGTSFAAALSNFQIKEHIFTGSTETNSKTIAATNYSTDGSTSVKIDASKVNTNKRGDYIINVEYTPEAVVVDSKTISYKVKAFIFVHVTDEVTKVEFESGTTTYKASAATFDYSDWKFRVTRKNSGEAIVDYNSTDFVVKNIVPFITGTQTASVTYLDYMYPVKIELTVEASDTYNIYTGNVYSLTENSEGELTCTGEVWSTDIAKDTTDVALDSSGLFKITNYSGLDANRLNSEGMSKDNYLNVVYFGPRYTVKGAGSYVSVKMDNPGILVVYAAASGSTEREVAVYDAPDSGNEIDTFICPETKKIVQRTIKIEEAGTYYIQCFVNGAYIHGVAIAVTK